MVDWNKPIQTVDGRKLKLVYTLNPNGHCSNNYNRICIVTDSNGVEDLVTYTEEGKYNTNDHDRRHAVNVPEVRKIYTDIWQHSITKSIHTYGYDADDSADTFHQTRIRNMNLWVYLGRQVTEIKL